MSNTTVPWRVAERLAAGLVRMPNGCLEWTGTKRDPGGYGQIWVGRHVRTHRLAWELVNGPIPPGMVIGHRCDNPPCCDPEHLFLGTQADNVADMDAKDRKVCWGSMVTHCPAGHEYAGNNLITHRGHRYCRECQRLAGLRYRAKRRARERAALDAGTGQEGPQEPAGDGQGSPGSLSPPGHHSASQRTETP